MAALVAVVAASMPVVASRAIAAPPPLFQSETLIGGLNQPTTLQFLPDGRMLILERDGDIELVLAGATQVQPTPFLRLTNVNSEGDRGLVGITLDPGFATNSWYYVYYSANSPLRERVSRFTASGNGTVAGSEVIIWQDDRVSETEHHGGTLAFGPDGMLYVSVGDHFFASDAQLLTNFHGKILRMRSDGTVPSDNPFYDGNGPNMDAIWAYGLRNPFRFSFDAPTGRMYIGDVGGNETASATEEVHLGVAGANYGWPICEGVCSTPGMTNPIFTYPHGGRDAAVTGGFVYRGTQFPTEYVGSYFYGDYVRNFVRRLTFNANGNVTGSVNFEPANGAEDGPYGEIVDLKQGPEGALYYVDIGLSWLGPVNPGTIRRIRYTAANQPPVVAASANPTSGPTPLSVAFSSAGSSDPEGQPLTYSWAFGDGQTSNQPNPTHVYTAIGNYTARLTVSDGVNQTISAPIAITAGNRPQATILTPTAGSTFRAGDSVSFSGSATDIEDGVLPASAYTWTVLFLHESHTHPAFPPASGVSSGSFPIPTAGHDFSGNTAYQVVLTVTDSNGLQSGASVTIYPQKVNLSFTTSPPGRVITIDGIPRTTPYVHDTLVNFNHTISAPDHVAGGTSYTFASWSDGGAQTHVITVPATNSAYSATFNAAGPSPVVAAYGFDEGNGGTAQDASGNGNTLALTNTAWTPSGRYAGALSFNGTTSRARSATVLSFPGEFTVEAWVLNPTEAPYETVLTIGNDRNLFLAGGQIGFFDGTSDRMFGPLPAATWAHLAFTSDGAALRAYVNGVQVGATQNVALPATAGELQVGAWITGSTNADYFGGTIDEVRVYNRALAAGEIQTDMATPVNGPPPGDGTAPTVALTAPAAGATVSGTVNVDADASDDVGVAGVQFLLDGANLGAEDTVAPYSVAWDTLGASNGSHVLTARARDAAGNTTTSAARTVTVSNVAPPGGLVAAYAFDEGAGTAVGDASGSANGGTVSGAAWAAGRSGGALRFDGVNDLVTVPDAASLDLTGGMTIEAWVNPAAQPSGWRGLVTKERASNSLTYQLAANSSSNRPATRAYVSNGMRTLQGGTRLTAGTWVHLAATYDGATQRLYVNGTQVSSRAQTGTIAVTTNALRIGGSTTMGQYFNGTIDDVRVYNRALAAGEIQSDMATPVSPPPGDGTPPTVALTAPAAGAAVSGTVSVTADASDNVGVAGVQFLLDGANLGAEDTVAPYSVAWDTLGASNGSHVLTARARDVAGNTTTSAARTVTVANAGPPAGPLAAYAFDEGSGTTAVDASPNAVNATVTSPAWTASGRYGGAITFNGTSTRVTRTSPLALPGGFTIEAWVLNPTNVAYETIATVGTDRDLYLTNGTIGFFDGATDTTFGTVPVNTWTHIALVSSGTDVRVYVNGTQQGATQNVALADVTGTFQVGAWINGATNTDYLGGTIDEVRVYGRALSAADVQADMATPISPPP